MIKEIEKEVIHKRKISVIFCDCCENEICEYGTKHVWNITNGNNAFFFCDTCFDKLSKLMNLT